MRTWPWALVLFAVGGVARASTDDTQLHVSFSMLATSLSYGDTPFAFKGGEAGQLPGVPQMVDPLGAFPFSGERAYGLRADARWVTHHLRFGVGAQAVFPRWGPGDAQGTYSIGGVDRLVSTGSLLSKDARTAIGVDLPAGPVHLYSDLVGTLRFVSAQVLVDGASASFTATTFGFAVEAGAEVEIADGVRIGLQAERGFLGEQSWGGALGVTFVMFR